MNVGDMGNEKGCRRLWAAAPMEFNTTVGKNGNYRNHSAPRPLMVIMVSTYSSTPAM